MQIPRGIRAEVLKEIDLRHVEEGHRRELRELCEHEQNMCRQHGVELVDGYAMRDRIHILLMIPPKYSVANTIGILKGKSAIRIFRDYLQVKRNFTGRHSLAIGYCVNTVGLDEGEVAESAEIAALFNQGDRAPHLADIGIADPLRSCLTQRTGNLWQIPFRPCQPSF